MKPILVLLAALSAVEFVGPSIAGAAGLEATSGYDAADLVCILTGLVVFFLAQFIASYF